MFAPWRAGARGRLLLLWAGRAGRWGEGAGGGCPDIVAFGRMVPLERWGGGRAWVLVWQREVLSGVGEACVALVGFALQGWVASGWHGRRGLPAGGGGGGLDLGLCGLSGWSVLAEATSLLGGGGLP